MYTALRNLGALFLNGRSTEKNTELGKALLERAAKMGFPNNELEERES